MIEPVPFFLFVGGGPGITPPNEDAYKICNIVGKEEKCWLWR